jgi:hypothetical protein
MAREGKDEGNFLCAVFEMLKFLAFREQLYSPISELSCSVAPKDGDQVSWRFESVRTPDLGTRDARIA